MNPTMVKEIYSNVLALSVFGKAPFKNLCSSMFWKSCRTTANTTSRYWTSTFLHCTLVRNPCATRRAIGWTEAMTRRKRRSRAAGTARWVRTACWASTESARAERRTCRRSATECTVRTGECWRTSCAGRGAGRSARCPRSACRRWWRPGGRRCSSGWLSALVWPARAREPRSLRIERVQIILCGCEAAVDSTRTSIRDLVLAAGSEEPRHVPSELVGPSGQRGEEQVVLLAVHHSRADRCRYQLTWKARRALLRAFRCVRAPDSYATPPLNMKNE